MFRTLLKPVLLVSALWLTAACQQQASPPPPPPDTRAEDEATIRKLVADWSAAAEAKDVAKFVSFYAPDASAFPPNAPIATGHEAIRKTFEELVALPGFHLKFGTSHVEVARMGDLAYETGTYELTVNDKKGTPVTTPGKYVVVWKKQADGSWKAVADIFNADK